jgi:hypothetical protein
MMFFVFVVALLYLQVAWGAETNLRTVGSRTITNVKKQDIAAAPYKPFAHTDALMEAVHSGKMVFEVIESMQDTTTIKNLADYMEMKSKALYDTKTIYSFDGESGQFVSLDHPDSTVRELSAEHLLHCTSAAERSPEPGTVLLGTSRGSWYSELSKSKRTLAQANLLQPHHHDELNSLLIVRKVTAVKADENGCFHMATESIKPIELFAGVRVEALVKYPFRHAFSKNTATRNLQGENIAQPDQPIIACAAPGEADDGMTKNPDPAFGIAGLDIDTAYTKGCIQYNYNDNAFDMNYDYNTQSAVSQQLTIIDGVICNNCYAYLGAGFLVIAEYSNSGETISAEIKLAGGTGANVDIAVNNPSISGSQTVPLLGKGGSTSIPLGSSGVTINVGFGGLTADISGSGSATGSAGFAAGFSDNLAIGLLYAGGSFQYPSSDISSYQAPTWHNSDIQLTSMNLVVDLIALLDVSVTWGELNANGDIALGTHVELDYGTSNQGLSATLGGDSGSGSACTDDTNCGNRKLSVSTSAGKLTVPAFKPGDSIPLTYAYSNLSPNSASVAFFSLVDEDTKHAYQIMTETFTASASGNGKVSTKWIVPWDVNMLSAALMHIDIKTSNKLSLVASTPQFTLEMTSITATGIFTWPHANTIFTVNAKRRITWRAALLTYFEVTPGSYRHGYIKKCQNAKIELYGEKLNHQNGRVLASMTYNVPNGKSKTFRNTGSAVITIPADVVNGFDRFYFVVRSNSHHNVAGFSTGFFRFSNSFSKVPIPVAAFKTYGALARFKAIVGTGLTNSCAAPTPGGFDGKTPGFRALAAPEPQKQQVRSLQSACSNQQLSLTYFVTSSGSLSTLCVSDLCANVGITSSSIQLMSPQSSCFNV